MAENDMWGFRMGGAQFRPARELEEMRRRFEDAVAGLSGVASPVA